MRDLPYAVAARSMRSPKRKAGRRRGFHSFGSPAVFARPVAFRPRLTTGLAFREWLRPHFVSLPSSLCEPPPRSALNG